MISARTKAALAAAKARGQKLGGYKGGPVVKSALGTAAIRRDADAFALRVGPTMAALRGQGMSLRQIARELQARGVKSARGGAWTARAVLNVLARHLAPRG